MNVGSIGFKLKLIPHHVSYLASLVNILEATNLVLNHGLWLLHWRLNLLRLNRHMWLVTSLLSQLIFRRLRSQCVLLISSSLRVV